MTKLLGRGEGNLSQINALAVRIALGEVAVEPLAELPGRPLERGLNVGGLVMRGHRAKAAGPRLDGAADVLGPVLVGVLILEMHLDAGELVGEMAEIIGYGGLGHFDDPGVAVEGVVGAHLNLHLGPLCYARRR